MTEQNKESAILDIINYALHRCNENNDYIINTKSKKKHVQDCLMYYHVALRKLLEKAEWKFTLKTASLKREKWVYLDGYRCVYRCPTDLMTIIAVKDAKGRTIKHSEVISKGAQKYIGCQKANAQIVYKYENKDASLFSAKFVEALKRELAYEFFSRQVKTAYDIFQSVNMHEQAKAALQEAIEENNKVENEDFVDDTES